MYSGPLLLQECINYCFYNNGSPYSLLQAVGICPSKGSVRVWCLVGGSLQCWACRWEPPGGFVRQKNPCQGFNCSFCLPTSNTTPLLVHLGECYVPSAILTGLFQSQGCIPAWRRTCCLHSYWSVCQLWVWEAENSSPCVLKPQWLHRHQQGYRICEQRGFGICSWAVFCNLFLLMECIACGLFLIMYYFGLLFLLLQFLQLKLVEKGLLILKIGRERFVNELLLNQRTCKPSFILGIYQDVGDLVFSKINYCC